MKRHRAPIKQEVLIYGAGGHSKVTIDLLQQLHEDYRIIGILDDNPQFYGRSYLGYKVLGGMNLLREREYRNCKIVIGVAKPDARRKIFEKVNLLGYEVITLIHPSAYIASHVDIACGSMVMAYALINVGARIGKCTVINTGAIVEHECIVGDFVHIAPGAHLAGAVEVGSGTLIGIGATIIEFVRIGENAIISAGAVVIDDVPSNSTVVGNPARIVKRRQ